MSVLLQFSYILIMRKQLLQNIDTVLRCIPPPEDDCRELIYDIQRNYHLPWKARTVGEMIAVARQESGARKLGGLSI